MAPHPHAEQFVVVPPKSAEDLHGFAGRDLGIENRLAKLFEYNPRR
ncbi:hypothetical protein [Polyangium aurulentum]|nr:hypothetical protein [Polyangium aurulentum]UQA58130.1 hypothetical protein E8A73_043910 [Polyangium aurulentum]